MPAGRTKAGSLARIFPILCLSLFSSYAIHAGGKEQPEVQVRKEGEGRFVQGEIHIQAPQKVVWEVLTDYNNLADFMPHMEKSRLLSSDADGWLRLEQVSSRRILLFKKRIRVLLRVFEHPPDRVSFSLIDGDFRTYNGAWDVDPIDGRLRLRLTLRLSPAFFAPGFILDRLARSTAEKSLEAVRDEALRRMRDNPPAD